MLAAVEMPLMLIVVGLGQWACGGFIVKNQLKQKISIFKPDAPNAFDKKIHPGKQEPCKPTEKGCHDREERHKEWVDLDTVSLIWYCSNRNQRPFSGPRDAMFRFNDIAPNDKNSNVKVTVFEKEIEDDKHIINHFDFDKC